MAGYERAIVRLRGWAASRPTAGLGLLAGAGQLVTCAHVVNSALGRGLREQAQPGESDLVQVEFPLLPETPVRLARVVTWVPPPRSGAGGGDVAGLVLTEVAPGGAAPARFALAAPGPGTRLRVFGYPGDPAREGGMWVDVDLKGEVGGQLLQVESRGDQTVKAQPGYSGSPVWDDSAGEAVGLVQSAPLADEPDRDASLLPPLAIARAWEVLFDYLLVPENPYRGLEPFTAEQAAVFFGRDADIAALAARVRAQPVVVVVGPSGAGKSSLVQAGLIPALQREQRWSVALVRPGKWSCPSPTECSDGGFTNDSDNRDGLGRLGTRFARHPFRFRALPLVRGAMDSPEMLAHEALAAMPRRPGEAPPGLSGPGGRRGYGATPCHRWERRKCRLNFSWSRWER